MMPFLEKSEKSPRPDGNFQKSVLGHLISFLTSIPGSNFQCRENGFDCCLGHMRKFSGKGVQRPQGCCGCYIHIFTQCKEGCG